MAKSATALKIEPAVIDKELLAKVASGEVKFLSAAQGNAMVMHNPPLIEVNTTMLDPTDNTKAAVRATLAATAYLTINTSPVTAVASSSNYALISNAVLPAPKKRGNSFGSGAPTKYPFADMTVGSSFFSANSEHAKGDALKALGSTVSSQNRKYATETGETKTQKRAKRDEDNKAILDADGNKIIEIVTLPVLKYERKFTIRAVSAGQTYGGWVAPADGALIGRTV
jgi:hypothetical protein